MEEDEDIQENDVVQQYAESIFLEFDKELFILIEEVRRYMCMWDINSEFRRHAKTDLSRQFGLILLRQKKPQVGR